MAARVCRGSMARCKRNDFTLPTRLSPVLLTRRFSVTRQKLFAIILIAIPCSRFLSIHKLRFFSINRLPLAESASPDAECIACDLRGLIN